MTPVADKSSIEWTDATWNPSTGCDRVSTGCEHCYALTLAKRLQAMGNVRYQTDGNPRSSGPGFGLTLHYDLIDKPKQWTTPRRIFVNSMSDVFHPRIPALFVSSILGTVRDCPQHVFQVLTKRPERMARLIAELQPDPLPNLWLGTSIENLDYISRLDTLKEIPAAIRFLSLEPLLGPLRGLDLDRIHWVIVGGESGPHYRPVDLGWIREIRDQCLAKRVAFFLKQIGGQTPKAGGRELDGRIWSEWPDSSFGSPDDDFLDLTAPTV